MLYVNQNELKALWAQYKRNWWLFAISICGCLLLAVAFVKVKNKRFEVYTTINILEGNATSNMAASMAKSSGFGDILGVGGSEVDNEIVILSSHNVLYNAVKETGYNVVYTRRPVLKKVTYWKDQPIELTTESTIFSDTLGPSLYFTIKLNAEGSRADIYCKNSNRVKVCDLEDVPIPGDFETLWGKFHLATTSTYEKGESMKVKVTWNSYTNVAQNLQHDMQFGLANKKGHVVTISNKDVNPGRSIDLLNAIIHQYDRYTIQAKNLSTTWNMEFMQNRLDTISQELSALESSIEEYKQKHNLSHVETQTSIAIQKANSVEERLLNLQISYETISQLEAFAKSPENQYSLLPYALGQRAGGVAEVINEYNTAIDSYIALKQTALPNNPSVVQAERTLKNARTALLLSIEAEKKAMESIMKETKKQEGKLNGMVNTIPTIEREYVDLERQKEIKQRIYLMLKSQQEQNALAMSMDTPKGILVDEAYVDVLPSGPSTKLILAAALIMALLLPMCWLRLLDWIKPTLSSPDAFLKMDGISADIYTLDGSDTDYRMLAQAINTYHSGRAILLSMQGEAEEIAQPIAQALSILNSDVKLIETPAFVEKPDAMFELSDAAVAVLVGKQDVTLNANKVYIETLSKKGLLRNLLVAYIK